MFTWRRMEKTDSLEAHKAEVVQLREKVTSLEERASTEQRRKESCQGEIERLSRQVRLAEGKASHWEEAAREIHTPKHQRQRRGSKGGSSSASVGAEDVDVSDGAVELRVQMAELKHYPNGERLSPLHMQRWQVRESSGLEIDPAHLWCHVVTVPSNSSFTPSGQRS